VDLVDCDDVGDAADMDRPEDVARLEAAWNRLRPSSSYDRAVNS
jgi:hypothetical protein